MWNSILSVPDHYRFIRFTNWLVSNDICLWSGAPWFNKAFSLALAVSVCCKPSFSIHQSDSGLNVPSFYALIN